MKDRPKLPAFLITTGAVILLYLPWTAIFYSQMGKVAESFWIGPVNWYIVLRSLVFPFSEKFGNFNFYPDLSYAGLAFIWCAAVFGIVKGIKSKSLDAELPVFFAAVYILTLSAAIAVSFLIKPIFIERYTYVLLWRLATG